jgi:hypothetical protein
MFRATVPAAALLIVLAACNPPLPESELVARIQKSSPQWQSYQEDIKAQIGAQPVAEWAGEPVNAIQQDAAVSLTFRLLGPWALRDAAIPILIQDPLGHVHQNAAASRRDSLVTYEFKLESPSSTSPFPWLEVRFPNGNKRIVFNEKGAWDAP